MTPERVHPKPGEQPVAKPAVMKGFTFTNQHLSKNFFASSSEYAPAAERR